MREIYERWLAAIQPRSAIMAGVQAGPLPYGSLKDTDIQQGGVLTAGGYGEDRDDYSSELFSPLDGSEPRTVHLGLDIFAAAGTPVFAPLQGRVHSFADNAGDGDYGPTVILEHAPAPGLLFHTLYGHLSRESLSGMESGREIPAGQQLGWLGDRTVNGGWAPHLHVQVILELGQRHADYPGACRRSEQARWLAACPDPALLLGVQIASRRS